MSDFKFGRSSKKNMKGVRETIIQLAERVLSKSNHDFGIPKYGGKRTPQEQNNLYHSRVNGKRVTQLDGFKNKSYHQSGNALDIFIYDEHDGKMKACWSCKEKYKEVADLFKQEFDLMKSEGLFEENEILIWGGDWKRFKDEPHFEIRTK